MAGEPLGDEGFSDDYDDRMGIFYEPKIDREHTIAIHNLILLDPRRYIRRLYGGDDDPCPFDDEPWHFCDPS